MEESSNNNQDLQLPGYKLQKLLGAGGYGEVWLASAPGGLTKAVKIIFGYHNEKRASSELKSLEKIKSVRHPFLLSLERIEVIEGRLVIVSELADGSLKDRFEHHRNQGKQGIPRDELLGYLKDSADALDYLSDHHSLQHLDVKPENLLLLAGHVKVADFGLVKKIQDTQASLIGGMTPLYSAPEVFQGTPTSYSDQYSLAVMYQEMLTGKLPFEGTTSAELTLQHMHDDPDLSPLPLSDRYVLARALSKDPKQRYASCSELVKALLATDQSAESGTSDWNARPQVEFAQPSAVADPRKKSRPGTMTQVFEDELIEDPADVSESMLLELPSSSDEEVLDLPELDLQDSDARPCPTLIIGIGGTAGHVLSQVRQRLSARYGRASLPSVQLLLLDTDKQSLIEQTHSDAHAALTAEETLSLPLRRPQEYRDHSKRLLGWLSRRWLYNIPKSLRTEGLRPLGRLAFADHARRTIQRIRLSLSEAMDSNALEQSGECTGLPFDGEAVRVYVVSSISGGTGSGMSIDVAYAIKGLLEKLGIENATTTGILLHSTGRDSRYCDLAKVNAFSWLQEYNHFARPGGFYPGDEAIGLPAMSADTPAFDHTYFVKLGDGLTTEQLQERTSSVAQYLMLDSLSSAKSFFASCRDAIPSVVGGMPALRTFGVHEETAVSQEALDTIAHQLCQRVVLGWSGTIVETKPDSQHVGETTSRRHDSTSINDTNQIISGAPRAVASLQLNLEGISGNARSILEDQFGNDLELMIDRLLEQAVQESGELNPAQTFQLVDSLFLAEPSADKKSCNYVCGRPLDAVVSPLGMKLAADLQQWLLQRLDEEQERLAGTRQAAEWFSEHFQRVEMDAKRLASGIGNKLVNLVNQFNGTGDGPATAANLDPKQRHELAIKYFRLRLDYSALHATGHLVRTLQSELKNLREAIVEFGRHLRHLADKLNSDSELANPATARLCDSQDPITQSLMMNLPDLVAKTDERIQREHIGPAGGLFKTVMGNRKVMTDLLESLRTIASEHVTAVSKECAQSGTATQDQQEFATFASKAKPALLKLGGFHSQLVVLPNKELSADASQEIRDALESETSILTACQGHPSVCSEVGGLSLARVAINLIECRRDYAEFADRVHTRNDISWAPLIEVPQPVASSTSEYATQVL